MKSKIIGRKQLLIISLTGALGLAVFVNWYYTNPQRNNLTEPEVTSEVNLGEAQYVNSGNVTQSDYFSSAKLKRTQSRDISKEHLESIVSGSEFDEDTKASAREQLIKIADNIKKETDIENLITAQTGGECLVILDSDNIEVILPDGTIKEDILLKIKDIIISKTDFSADKITVIERSNMK